MAWRRRTTRTLVAGSVLALVGAAACGGGNGPGAAAPDREQPADGGTVAARGVPVTFECLPDERCPQLTVSRATPATLPSGAPSPLRGDSDPSIRREPGSQRLWMTYSSPGIHVAADGTRGTKVETRLAHSDDGGRSWVDDGVLWPAEPTPDLEPLGPGASAYDPDSETGIVLMRRVIGPASLVATLHETGLHP